MKSLAHAVPWAQSPSQLPSLRSKSTPPCPRQGPPMLCPTQGRAGGWHGIPWGDTDVTSHCSGCLGGELWRWLSAYTCGLVCVSSILAGTAGLLWMREEGTGRFGGGAVRAPLLSPMQGAACKSNPCCARHMGWRPYGGRTSLCGLERTAVLHRRNGPIWGDRWFPRCDLSLSWTTQWVRHPSAPLM